MFNIKQILKQRKLKKERKLHDKPYLDKPIELLEPKHFEYKIVYDTNEIQEGECIVNYEDDLAEMFLRNKYTICNNNENFIWYNSDRILFFEAKEIKKDKKGEK